MNTTLQGARPEDARQDGRIRGRSRSFMNNPGLQYFMRAGDPKAHENRRAASAPLLLAQGAYRIQTCCPPGWDQHGRYGHRRED